MEKHTEFEKPITYKKCEFCGTLVALGEDASPHWELSLALTNGMWRYNKDNSICLCPECFRSFETWFCSRKEERREETE